MTAGDTACSVTGGITKEFMETIEAFLCGIFISSSLYIFTRDPLQVTKIS